MFANQFKAFSQIYPEISVSPTNSYALPGQKFNISITISNVAKLYAYQVYISFNPEVLEVIDVIQGDFLKRGVYKTFWQPKWNNSQGLIQVWESMLRPDPETSGSGELFKVTFKVKEPGSSILDLQDTKLSDPFKGPITHLTNDGIFSTVKLALEPKEMRGAEYAPGRNIAINLTLYGAIKKLYGFNITIKYDVKIINATHLELHELLQTPNENQTTIDHLNGIVSIYFACKPGAPSTNNTGRIATLFFNIIDVGETSIQILNSKLLDIDGEEILHLIQNAYIYNVLRNIAIIPSETSVSSLLVKSGETVTLTLKISNTGVLNETSYLIVYGLNDFTAIIGGPVKFTIERESNITLEVTLSTIGLEGNYTILIVISPIPGESTLSDNSYQYPSLITVYPKAQKGVFPSELILAFIAAVIVVAILGIILYKYKSKEHEKDLKVYSSSSI